MASGTRRVVVAAFIGNLLVALAKFAAAWFTHSSAMLSEAIHSLVDTMNQLVMLYGMKRASRPPDRQHPLGHGRELYFWSFVVAVLIFSLGAGVSVYEGIHHIQHPQAIESPLVNYLVLGVAAVFEGGSWMVAFREFRAHKGEQGYFEAAQATKDPSTLTVFLEDSAALIGIAFAFGGTAAAQLTGNPLWDGAASIAIGALLAIVAIFLARESKQLLIGESARREVSDAVLKIASSEPGVVAVNGLLTLQLAPRQIVVALSVEFADSFKTSQIEAAVDAIEARLHQAHPDIYMLLVKPQTAEAYRRHTAERMRRGVPGT